MNAMSKPPRLDPDNPLAEFAGWMGTAVQEIRVALVVLGFAVALLALIVFAGVVKDVYDYRERKRQRKEIASLLKVVAQANEITDAKTDRVAGELKDEIKAVPPAVVAEMAKTHAGESGIMPRPAT